MINERYLAECGDPEELMAKIEELESRIAALEGGEECEDGECDEVCPECGEDPCVCDVEGAEEELESEDGIIDEEDVDEIEELNFDEPHFLEDDEESEDEDGFSGGLYDYDSDEENEDGPYFN